VSAILAWSGAYLITRAQNNAIRADFSKALAQIREQTQAVKKIEENIAYNYWEKRELFKIMRGKIEEIYEAASKELEEYSKNHSIAMSDIGRDIVFPSNRVEMLISLYFKDELNNELEYYREKRGRLATHIRQLCQKNMERSNTQLSIQENTQYFGEGNQLFSEFNQAKINIELALEDQMKKLNQANAADAKSRAAD
jgi:NTP pyrophosphatase (non-canonical NTP hydrolase)